MELHKGAKFSATKAHGVKGANYDKAEGSILVTILEVHSIR